MPRARRPDMVILQELLKSFKRETSLQYSLRPPFFIRPPEIALWPAAVNKKHLIGKQCEHTVSIKGEFISLQYYENECGCGNKYCPECEHRTLREVKWDLADPKASLTDIAYKIRLRLRRMNSWFQPRTLST